MTAIVSEFTQTPFFPELSHRGPSFARMVDHVERNRSLTQVIETGTARIAGNWGGDGQSTLIWDWLADRLPITVTSIDIEPEAVAIARSQVKHVEFIVGDSVCALAAMRPEKLRRTALLYLDSYDWTPETHLESAFHHLAELASVWAYLPSGCMIAVDDVHGQFVGKHVMVYRFMSKLGIEPAFAGSQAGWIKP